MNKNDLVKDSPLLTTKLHIPQPRARLVARPRLIRRLNDGATRPLVLISAPAGFGKTTLLAGWIPQSENCVCWVSLDDGDNDPARFWSYIIGALQMLQSTLGQSAQALLDASRLRGGRTPPRRQATWSEPFLTALLNDLAAFPDHFCLVLDDYHVIENQAIHRGMAFFLGHLPPQLHLILTSRSDPPLPLARLRARDQMLELRAADLRFTVDEVAAFLNQIMGLSLSADDIAALEKCTEGWVAGLQLAALSLQGHEDASRFIADFAGGDRFILEYLTEEVLHRQPEAVQSFLLKTSILDRLTGPLCDAVIQGNMPTSPASPATPATPGSPDGAGFLDMLDHANLFIAPLDSKRCWYRYHPLFADLLRGHLAQTLPNEVPVLHVRASEWFEQNGLIDEAVDHALAAQDSERVARLLEGAAREVLFTRFEPYTLLGWLAAVPAGFIAARPALGLAEAWGLVMTGQRKAANDRLDAIASAGAAPPNAADRGTLGEVAAVRATLAIAEADAPRILEQARLASALLPEADQAMRAKVANVLGIGHRYAGNALAAERAFADAAWLSEMAGDPVTTHISAGLRANLIAEQGRLREAAEAQRQLEDLPAGGDWHPQPALGETYIRAGAVLREWNDLDGATRWIGKGIELARQGDLHLIVLDGYVGLALVAQARPDPDEALALLDQALEYGRQHNQPLRNGELMAWQARLQLRQGDLAAALRWAEESGLAVDHEVPYRQEDAYLTLARVLVAQARENRRGDLLQGAAQLLERLLQAAESGGRKSRVVEVLVLQALTGAVQGRPAQALAWLGQALDLAEPEGYWRTFVDEGAPLASLLERYRDSLRSSSHQVATISSSHREQSAGTGGAPAPGRLLPYTEKLLAGFASEMTAGQRMRLAASSDALPAWVQPLTSHELAVLRLLAAGLSAPQIAEKYVLSINTIKTQIKSIYAKLGVHSRAEALAAATELHLL